MHLRTSVALVLASVAIGCDGPADSTSGTTHRVEPVMSNARLEKGIKVDRGQLAQMASQHNAAMREVSALVKSGATKSWTTKQICEYERALVTKYSNASRADLFVRERASAVTSYRLTRILPPKLHRFVQINEEAGCSNRELGSGLGSAAISFVQLDDPAIPLTIEAQQLLVDINEHAADEPTPVAYSARLNSVRSASLGLDSLEQLLVFATAEVADSSYRYWYVELPVLAYAMMDGSEVGDCTPSGLEDGANTRVLEKDAQGAGVGALRALLRTSTWALGWNSAVPLVVGEALVGGIAGSGVGSLIEITLHRRPRCP